MVEVDRLPHKHSVWRFVTFPLCLPSTWDELILTTYHCLCILSRLCTSAGLSVDSLSATVGLPPLASFYQWATFSATGLSCHWPCAACWFTTQRPSKLFSMKSLVVETVVEILYILHMSLRFLCKNVPISNSEY